MVVEKLGWRLGYFAFAIPVMWILNQELEWALMDFYSNFGIGYKIKGWSLGMLWPVIYVLCFTLEDTDFM